jgi:hypothetical protein
MLEIEPGMTQLIHHHPTISHGTHLQIQPQFSWADVSFPIGIDLDSWMGPLVGLVLSESDIPSIGISEQCHDHLSENNTAACSVSNIKSITITT